ncbi:MAG TPA: VOC family protein [Gammaproteobacteria bacterium]|nr:VOC family protein [Gammaproteobacteria bacterium]
MAIHLRQICLVAEHLVPAIRDLSGVFSIRSCYVDPEVGKFGLENTLLPVGSRFLELVAPTREGTAAGRFLQRRGGAGGYMVICQVPTLEDQAAVRARAGDNGVRVAFEADRGSWNIMQLHPGDMGASFLEVDWDREADPTGNWEPAGGKGWKDAVCTDVVSDIVAVELQGERPGALAERWAAVTGLPLERGDGAARIRLANADLRFVPARDGRGDGLGALDLRVADRTRLLAEAARRGARVSDDQVMICGTRFNLVD